MREKTFSNEKGHSKPRENSQHRVVILNLERTDKLERTVST